MKVGILGASGYAGTELLRLAAAHPAMEVAVAAARSAAGRPVAEHTPALAAAYPDLVLSEVDPKGLGDLDVAFCALPHGESQDLVPELVDRVGLVVDLGADFRLAHPDTYRRWYGTDHRAPHLLGQAVNGLVEHHRAELEGARLIAVPGCYPTAAALALVPLVRAGLLDATEGVVVDAVSGVSGAGRAATAHLHFGEVDGGVSAYGLLEHRHTPEMEQAMGTTVLFTPHLAPMTRGILATCYARPAPKVTTGDVEEALQAAYAHHRFVTVVREPPSTKATLGSNSAFVAARADARSGRVVALCVLDNLGKGAAGQAVQAMNVALGRPEAEGLSLAGTYP